MRNPLRLQLDARRLEGHQRDLLRREQDALARLGGNTLAEGGARGGRLAALAAESGTIQTKLEAMSRELRTAAGASNADLRGRRQAVEQKQRELFLTAGRLVMAMPAPAAGSEEVEAIRAERASAANEQARLRAERQQINADFRAQVRGWLTPRAPALTAMGLGWWIARRYSDSHLRELLKTFGLSSRLSGHHLISLSTDTQLLQYGLPLLAAVVCAYLGHRIAPRVLALAEAYRIRSGRVAGER